MANKKHEKGYAMSAKPRPLGYTAGAMIDEARMANSMCIQYLSSVLTNDLTKEGIYKAVGLAIKEASEAQMKLTDAKYIGR